MKGGNKQRGIKNERARNMRNRIEIKNIKALNHAGIAESEHESDASDVFEVVDKAAFEKLERNFKRSDFYFDQDDSFGKNDD
jgi:ribosomal protein S19E (S16A)